MQIFQAGDEDVERAAQIVLDEDLIGFDTYSSIFKNLRDKIYEHLENQGARREAFSEGWTDTDFGYIYFLRNSEMVSQNEAEELIKRECQRMALSDSEIRGKH